MYSLRLAFQNATDDRLIVDAVLDQTPNARTVYEDEECFLRRLIAADLEYDQTRDLVIAVIQAVANPQQCGDWVEIRISARQKDILGLNLTPSTSVLPNPFSFLGNGDLLNDFLLHSPTPFAMATGPKHIVTFLNDAYVQLLGRSSAEPMLGLPLLEAIPELAGQVCLTLLDTAFQTGKVQKRVELPCLLREQDTGLMVDAWFDILYQPVRSAEGEVVGIMAQAADVTERVLARRVADHRELQIHQLRSELEALTPETPSVEKVVKGFQTISNTKTRINIGENNEKKFA